jgi:hypothetical protein
MLDRLKLTKQITNSSDNFFSNQTNQVELAVKTWQAIIVDQGFKQNLASANLPWSMPSWEGELGSFVQTIHQKIDYTVVASDGSQVYPDRHAGTNCYLINTGISILRYNAKSSASFSSEPYFFTDISQAVGGVTDFVDSRRHELEIADGLIAIQNEMQIQADKLVYLADGSLIAWHLTGKGDALQNEFLPNYLQQLNNFYQKKVPFVGYISLPNSKELINLLRAKLCNFEPIGLKKDFLDTVVDADLMSVVLEPGQCTSWFKSNVSATKFYPEPLKPYFAYINTGTEIARLEIPAWILADIENQNLCLQIVVDQVEKGRGYPVALAEAHQQAVIKSEDRRYFYDVIKQMGSERGMQITLSRKARQKQVMGI